MTLAILYGMRARDPGRCFRASSRALATTRGNGSTSPHSPRTTTEDKDDIPDFLTRYETSFDPLYIKPWQSGALIGALGPLDFRLPMPWNLPYVATLDPQGSVVAQWDGATILAAIDAALQSQLAR